VTAVRAGSHGDLAQAHADMGPEGLIWHLRHEHEEPVPGSWGAAWMQETHRQLHEEGR
jgi:hypothetical protein